MLGSPWIELLIKLCVPVYIIATGAQERTALRTPWYQRVVAEHPVILETGGWTCHKTVWNVNFSILVLSIWLFTTHCFQLLGMFGNCYNKMLGDKVKNKIWWPLRAVTATSSLSRINGKQLSRSMNPAKRVGEMKVGGGALGVGSRGSSSCLRGGHGDGTPAHRGSCLCSQESLHHLELLCGTSPARQAVTISSSASSLPRGAALQTMTLLSKWKTSVPGFHQELLELVKGTLLLKSWSKW